MDCLLDTIEADLDAVLNAGIKASLIIVDGPQAPDFVKNRCDTITYTMRGSPATMCAAWDTNYLEDKQTLITALGQRSDNHPALAYMYFTGVCSSNGAEGHCRID